MSSNEELFEAVQLRLKLRGEWPPPRISAATSLQKWRDDNRHNLFDLDAILKEARAAGANLAEVTRFRANPHDLQVEEILKTTNTAEPQLAEEEEGAYLAREAQKRANWLAQKDRLNLEIERSKHQSERDKTRFVTPTGSPAKTRLEGTLTPDSNASTPERPAYFISRRSYNKLRRTDSREERFGSTEEWIESEKKKGRERKLLASSGEFVGWGDYPRRIQEAAQSTRQMSPSPVKKAPSAASPVPAPKNHGSLVDRTRPRPGEATMDPSKETGAVAELNSETEKNLKINTVAAGPAEVTNKSKKEKAPKQPKAPKAAPSTAPLTPAVIDLRVGHILRAVEHPNADTMYVSTIAMGDPEGAEHTEVDEQTGKVVRTVCSGLKAYIKLEDMQDRKIVVVANLKPANLRSIKSAAMVLAASPKPENGADPHSPDRTVELVQPPPGSEAGDKVYFEGWPYGEGKGPEKQLNPKKKTWEMLQPGFYTTDDLVVAFDSSKSEMEDKSSKGELVVEGKGKCTVASLKGAIVR
jgi:tRNA-binding EMAP/Myf-like protein